MRADELDIAEIVQNVNTKTFKLKALNQVSETADPKRAAERFVDYWENKGYKVADIGGPGQGRGSKNRHPGCGYGLVKGKKITSKADLMVAYRGRITKQFCRYIWSFSD